MRGRGILWLFLHSWCSSRNVLNLLQITRTEAKLWLMWFLGSLRFFVLMGKLFWQSGCIHCGALRAYKTAQKVKFQGEEKVAIDDNDYGDHDNDYEGKTVHSKMRRKNWKMQMLQLLMVMLMMMMRRLKRPIARCRRGKKLQNAAFVELWKTLSYVHTRAAIWKRSK